MLDNESILSQDSFNIDVKIPENRIENINQIISSTVAIDAFKNIPPRNKVNRYNNVLCLESESE